MVCVSRDIKGLILRKLRRHGYVGGRHTSIVNLPKGLPTDLRGEAKEVINELIKDELIIAKPTHDGLHISLNPRKMDEINALLL